MTKAELLKELDKFPDDTEIRVAVYDEDRGGPLHEHVVALECSINLGHEPRYVVTIVPE